MQVNLVLDKANLTGNVIFKQYQHIKSIVYFGLLTKNFIKTLKVCPQNPTN